MSDELTDVATRPLPGDLETRSAPEAATAAVAVEGRRLHGLVPFDAESRDLGGWRERIAPGAFAATRLDDLVATVDHAGVPIGRYPGTLAVEHADDGLRWSVELPESRSDVREAVERGDLRSSSWRMVVGRDRWEGTTRVVEEVAELRDVAVVTTPAYPSARAEYRSAEGDHHTTETDFPTHMSDEPDTTTTTAPDGLTLEARADAGGATVEARVLDAMRGVPAGESRSLTTVDASAGPVVPEEIARVLWDRLRPAAVTTAMGVTEVTTERHEVRWPRLLEDVTPHWLGELEPIPESDPDLDELVTPVHALKALVRGSSEAFDDSDPSLLELVAQNLSTSLALKLDRDVFIGDGAGGKGIIGLATLAGQVLDAGGTLTDYDALLRAVAMLRGANATGPYTAVLHPFTLSALERKKKQQDSLETLPLPIGAPTILTTTALPRNAEGEAPAFVLAPQEVVLVKRLDATVEVDRSRAFETDGVLVRGKLRAGLLVPRPAAVVRIDNLPAPDPAAA